MVGRQVWANLASRTTMVANDAMMPSRRIASVASSATVIADRVGPETWDCVSGRSIELFLQCLTR